MAFCAIIPVLSIKIGTGFAFNKILTLVLIYISHEKIYNNNDPDGNVCNLYNNQGTDTT